MFARTRRLDLAAAQTVHLYGRVMAMEIAIQQRHIQMLTDSRAFAMEQRRDDRERRMHPGADVAQRGVREIWRTVRLADHGSDT
jgi:hypothetical protein